MSAYVALLRAVNLGPRNRLAMADLKRIAQEAGLRQVRTYLASGNLVFESAKGEAVLKADLEGRLKAHAGRRIDVTLRTAGEMASIVQSFPFKNAPAARSVVIFLDGKVPSGALEELSGQTDEQLALGKREIFVAYGAAGIGRSKLTIPAAKAGTARNMNTAAKLAELAAETES